MSCWEGARVLAAYAASGGPVPAEPWVFGGWVSATTGWLVHNATTRIGTPPGVAETTLALDRLLALRSSLHDRVNAVADAR